MRPWYSGRARGSKPRERCSIRLGRANGRVPKFGLRGQVATLLFAGSNPAALSTYEEVSLVVKLQIVALVSWIRFPYFLPFRI